MIMVDNFGPNDTEYLAIDKSQLLQATPNLVYYQYNLGNFNSDFDAEPARMRGDTLVGGPIYLVEESSALPNGIRVVKVTNELSNSPTFTEYDIAVDLRPASRPPSRAAARSRPTPRSSSASTGGTACSWRPTM